jgi:hypothetical protein
MKWIQLTAFHGVNHARNGTPVWLNMEHAHEIVQVIYPDKPELTNSIISFSSRGEGEDSYRYVKETPETIFRIMELS